MLESSSLIINLNSNKNDINQKENNKNNENDYSNFIDGTSKQINICLNNSIDFNNNQNIANNQEIQDDNKEINLEDYDIELDDDENDDEDYEEVDDNEDNENYYIDDQDKDNQQLHNQDKQNIEEKDEENELFKLNDNNEELNIDSNRCEICWIKYKRLISFGSKSLKLNNCIEENKYSKCQHQMCKKCAIKTFETNLEKNKDIDNCIWCGERISEILLSELLEFDYKLIIENKKIYNVSILNWECPSCQDKTLLLFNNTTNNSNNVNNSKIIININKFNNNNIVISNSNNISNNNIKFKDNKNNNSNNNKVICKKCDYIFCFTCNESHNLNQSCEEFLMKDESLLKTFKWKQSNTKRCPNCFVFIEKRGGCSFMRCANCSYEFCFECLSTYKKFHQCDNSEMVFKIIFMICAFIGSIYIVYLLKKVN